MINISKLISRYFFFKLLFFSFFQTIHPLYFRDKYSIRSQNRIIQIRIIQLPDYCHQSMNSLRKSIRNHGWINVWTHLVELYREREGE